MSKEISSRALSRPTSFRPLFFPFCFDPQASLLDCIPYTLGACYLLLKRLSIRPTFLKVPSCIATEVTKEYSRRIWWSEDVIAFGKDFQAMHRATKQDDRPAALAQFKQAKLSELRKRESVARSWLDWISQNAAEKAGQREAKKAVRRAEFVYDHLLNLTSC